LPTIMCVPPLTPLRETTIECQECCFTLVVTMR
jgi:hypothetical protein